MGSARHCRGDHRRCVGGKQPHRPRTQLPDPGTSGLSLDRSRLYGGWLNSVPRQLPDLVRELDPPRFLWTALRQLLGPLGIVDRSGRGGGLPQAQRFPKGTLLVPTADQVRTEMVLERLPDGRHRERDL